MSIDISIAQAIIRRSLTDEDLLRNDKRLNIDRLNKKLSKHSIPSNYRAIKKFTELEFRDCLIARFIHKKTTHRYERCEWVYLDIETVAEKRKSGESRYPSSFLIRIKTIDTKLKFLFLEGDEGEHARRRMDIPVLQLSTHCLERIIQRSQKQTVRDAIKLFKPVCLFLLFANLAIISQRMVSDSGVPFNRLLFYWTAGYIILKYEPNELPIILTWLPKNWFSEEQFAKFINFEKKLKNSSRPFVFDASDFNDSKVLTESDLVEFNCSEEWILDKEAT